MDNKLGDWRERFDKEFPEFGYPRGTRNDRMAAFISDLLASERAQVVKECLKLVDKHDPSTSRETSGNYWGKTLRAALTKIV